MKIQAIFLALLLLALVGCSDRAAKERNTVCILYEIKNGEDLRIDGTNQPGTPQPLCFVVGHHEVINGIDKAVLGMKTGESKTVRVLPEDAYGKRGLDYVDHFGKTVFLAKPNDTLSVWIKIENIR
ncbi:MAG: hypothetical protein GC178_03375 [Flavobacteriales bacterium]|nr:hypothetical protein [Flavobacteriales bacterium]